MDDDDSNLADYFKTRNSEDNIVNARGKEGFLEEAQKIIPQKYL